jgi:hypothetical protein
MDCFTIRRDYKGTQVTALTREVIGEDAYKTFTYAVASFAYLVEHNETISLEDWRWRIAKHVHPSERVISVLKAIDRARGVNDPQQDDPHLFRLPVRGAAQGQALGT